MQFSEFIHQFAERFGIEVPEIVDDAAAFDADGMPFFLVLAAKEGDIEYLVVASIPESATADEASAEPLDDASGGKGLAGFMLV